MCGIFGLISTRNNVGSQENCLKTIFHRGPDNHAIFSTNSISISHSRLAIQDLTSSGNQPMQSQDGNYIITYNGEIYNHLELRNSLSKKYTFYSTSDTETLLYGYIEYGKEILNKLNGIFSFAIYNKKSGDVFLARDPLGVKPLYYYHDQDNFLFSSEIKSFLQFPGLDNSIFLPAILNYTTLLYCPGKDTLFSKVKKLLPGHYAEINVNDLQELHISKYYQIPVTNTYSSSSENELSKELENILFKSIERQMLSDVPVGFFLSGGLDSSSIVALTRALYPNKKIQCFTTIYDDTKASEGFQNDLPYARLVAQKLNVDLEEIHFDSEILKNFDFMIYHLDEPITDPASLLVYQISKRASEMGYKVLISGTGGDEVFSGYRRHQAIQIEKIYKYISPSIFQFFAQGISKLKPGHPLKRRVEKLFKYSGKDKYERMASYFLWMDVAEGKNLFSKSILNSIKEYDPRNYYYDLLDNIPSTIHDLNKMLYLDMKTYLPDNNLTYVDKMSMAAGVEVRVPFLDIELVEFASKIPPDLKMKGINTKYLLRQLMKKYLPNEIINRPKTGFGAPVRKWITKDLDSKIQEYLSPKAISTRGIFDADNVWQLITDNKAGKIDASYSIWALLAIESWMRQFVDEKQ